MPTPRRRYLAPLGAALACLLAAGLNAQEDAAATTASRTNGRLFAAGSDWRLITSVTGRITYDDNIYISPANTKADTSFHLAPSISLGLGNFRTELAPFSTVPHLLVQSGEENFPARNFVFINYTPEGVLFTRYTGQNAFNQGARLESQWQSELLLLKASLHYNNLFDANIDAGDRLHEIAYTGNFDAAYTLSGKSAAGVRLFASHYDFPDAISYTDSRFSLYGQYQLTAKTRLALGGMVGRLLVDIGGNQTFGRPWLEVNYRTTQQLSFAVSVGDDIRSFSHQPSRSALVYSVTSNYHPDETFALSLNARRDLQVSALLPAENIVASIYEISLRERFFKRNFLTPSAGFTRDRYQPNDRLTSTRRVDNYQFYKLALARDVTARGTCEISYEYRRDISSLAEFAFTENVVSGSLSYRF